VWVSRGKKERAGGARPAGKSWRRSFVFCFGGGERFRNETQSVELIELFEVRVVAGARRRSDEGAEKGRIVVGWARPDSNRRSSLCESDVVTAGPRARFARPKNPVS
jgi:hypothetical protein